ncbi:MMPL family transporter [Streptomyces sp. ISL-22]|uniref:MMPL family transporter n=1 Tax=unclassified Streptomyces TaxID=2593676 RepID=UPI001BEC5554|nr:MULTISPECIES: MMPL family transporter [unclassified Streptomyces]MBT2418876.1 MMPL family transporter [Streptomyces sp. ISL-24]MBT2435691.1 MMPL family transporter [Streptomyces sp. ISL-22]
MLRRLGLFIAQRARTVLVLAALITLAAGAVGAGVFGHLKGGGFNDPTAPSAKAAGLIDEHLGGSTDLVLLVRPRQGTVDSPPVQSAGRLLTDKLAARPGVQSVTSYWRTPHEDLRAHNGRTGLVLVQFAGDNEEAATRAGPLVRDYVASSAAGPAFTVLSGGPLGINHDVTVQVAKDLGLAEAIAVPITLLLLVIVFRGLVPALIPLATAAAAIFCTFAELRILAAAIDVSVFALNLTTALGLGLAIDYGLLMVSRFREQMTADRDIEAAVVYTIATAGRTIIFSAATVMAALATLLVFPLYFLRSFAYAGVGVVATAALAALFVTPALLTVCGHRVAPATPTRRTTDGSSVWHAIARVVWRRPAAIAIPAVAVMALAATPLLGVCFGMPDERVLPQSATSRTAATVLHSDFPHLSGAGAIDVVLTGTTEPKDVDAYARSLRRVPGVVSVNSRAASRAGALRPADAVRHLTVRASHASNSAEMEKLVGAVRAVAPPSHSTALVGGAAAQVVDAKQAIQHRLPFVIVTVAASTFVLLFLFTGSVIQPLRALAFNAVGLAAVLGTLVWIFQDGNLSSLLGFTPMPMDTAMTLLMFCIVFGLSTDYEVFVLGRIKELHDQGLPAEHVVTRGLAHTGAIVSAAAALLAVSLLAFTTSSVSFIQMFGLGSGLAILLDATIVRGVLLPACFRLLGERIWYCPRRLRSLQARFALTE